MFVETHVRSIRDTRWPRVHARLVRAILVVSLLLAGRPVFAQSDFAAIDAEVKAAVARGEIPSAAYAVSRNGRVVHAGAFGYADRERHVRASVRTAYPLASLTKPITATALLVLQQRNGFSLDTPVYDLLPDHPRPHAQTDSRLREVTLARLLHHTAGLGTYARIYYGDDIAHAPTFPASLDDYSEPVQTPGVAAEYSNLGYGLLGDVIAEQSHTTFADYARRHVFVPLRMRDAFIAEGREHRERRGAQGYDVEMKPLPPLWNDTPGAGNAYASVDDLLRFGWFHLAPTADRNSASTLQLSAAAVAAMHERDADRARHAMYGNAWYGQGWYVRDTPKPLIWHEGGMPGASTLLALYPSCATVVTVLVNRTDAQTFVQSLAGKLVARTCRDAPPLALDPVSGFAPLTGNSAFTGEWQGSLRVDGQTRVVHLSIDAAGNGRIVYAPAPGETEVAREFHAIVSDGSLISAVQGPWQSHDAPNGAAALLIKFVRASENTLEGALVAYDGPQRLRFLLPYPVTLRRIDTH